ncbi:hypothetical protein Q7P37_011518 [Cladosporium fusiforme]
MERMKADSNLPSRRKRSHSALKDLHAAKQATTGEKRSEKRHSQSSAESGKEEEDERRSTRDRDTSSLRSRPHLVLERPHATNGTDAGEQSSKKTDSLATVESDRQAEQVKQPLKANPEAEPGRKWFAPVAPITHVVMARESALEKSQSPRGSSNDQVLLASAPSKNTMPPSSRPEQHGASPVKLQKHENNEFSHGSAGRESSPAVGDALFQLLHKKDGSSATSPQLRESDVNAVSSEKTKSPEEADPLPTSPCSDQPRSKTITTPGKPVIDEDISTESACQPQHAKFEGWPDDVLLSMSSADLFSLVQRVQGEIGRRLVALGGL